MTEPEVPFNVVIIKERVGKTHPFNSNDIYIDGMKINYVEKCNVNICSDEFTRVTVTFIARVGQEDRPIQKYVTPPEGRYLDEKIVAWIKRRLSMIAYSKSMESPRGGNCPITQSDADFYRGYNAAIESCKGVVDSMARGQ